MHRALVRVPWRWCVFVAGSRVARLKRTDFCASRFPAAHPSYLRSWSQVDKWIDPHQPAGPPRCFRPVHWLTGHKVDVYGHKQQTFTAGKHPWSAGPITKAQSKLEMTQLIPKHCNKILLFLEQKWIVQPTPWWTSCYTKQMCIYETKAMYINFDVFKRKED